MLFLFSGGQGNLIFALPVTPERDWEVAGGAETLGFCEPAGERDRRGGSVAMVWLGGMCRLSPARALILGKARGVLLARRGLVSGSLGCNPACLLLSGGVSYCRERRWSGPVCSSLGHPSARVWHHAEMLVMLVLSGVTVDAAPFIFSPSAGSGHRRRCSCCMGVGHAGPGSSLGAPGRSSEAYSALAANKIKPGLRLCVSYASDGSLRTLSRPLERLWFPFIEYYTDFELPSCYFLLKVPSPRSKASA